MISDKGEGHIAMAEQASAEYFVTCDDRIIKKGRDVQDKLKVKVRGVLDLVRGSPC